LVRKPGAFARYRYQASLFPTLTFRRASDARRARHGSRADVEYVRLLQVAARTSECAVETVLGRLLDDGTRWDDAGQSTRAARRDRRPPPARSRPTH
jgi:hypothetical protein